MAPGFVTVSEVARRWGQSHSTVLRQHVWPGHLRAQRIGNALAVSIDDLLRYEEKLLAEKKAEYDALAARLGPIAVASGDYERVVMPPRAASNPSERRTSRTRSRSRSRRRSRRRR